MSLDPTRYCLPPSATPALLQLTLGSVTDALLDELEEIHGEHNLPPKLDSALVELRLTYSHQLPMQDALDAYLDLYRPSDLETVHTGTVTIESGGMMIINPVHVMGNEEPRSRATGYP